MKKCFVCFMILVLLSAINMILTGNYVSWAQSSSEEQQEPVVVRDAEALMKIWNLKPQGRTKGILFPKGQTKGIIGQIAYGSETPVKLLVNFRSNSYQIPPDSETLSQLEMIGQVLNKDPKFFLEIAGHTDLRGDEKHNLWLSYKRASAVKSFLVAQYDITAKRLIVSAHGEYQPLRPDDSQEAHAINRRVQCQPIFFTER